MPFVPEQWIYAIDVSPDSPRPLDEGLTLRVEVIAPRKRDAIARVRRYIPGVITHVCRVRREDRLWTITSSTPTGTSWTYLGVENALRP